MSLESERLTLGQYARHRLCTKGTVTKAIRTGRLTPRSVESQPDGSYLIDPVLADQEWEENTDSDRQPASADQREAKAEKEHWQAKLAELKYKEAAGELVEAAKVKQKLQDVFMGARAKLLALPSRARQSLPHLNIGDITVIENLVREALEDLAEKGDS